MFRFVILMAALALVANGTRAENTQIFPPDTPSALRADWISSNFVALGEYPIWQSSSAGEIFRFTYLPTFRNPISIRVEISNDGVGRTIYKRGDGANGYDPGKTSIATERELSAREVREVQATLGFLKECADPRTKSGYDGSYWVFEYRDRSDYCAVYEWHPRAGRWRRAGELLFDLVGYDGSRK